MGKAGKTNSSHINAPCVDLLNAWRIESIKKSGLLLRVHGKDSLMEHCEPPASA